MEILFIILFILVLFYHIWYRSLIKRRIEGELRIKSWGDAYSYALKMNREKLLTDGQIKEMIELDQETKKKYEKGVPNEEGIFKLDFKKLNKNL